MTPRTASPIARSKCPPMVKCEESVKCEAQSRYLNRDFQITSKSFSTSVPPRSRDVFKRSESTGICRRIRLFVMLLCGVVFARLAHFFAPISDLHRVYSRGQDHSSFLHVYVSFDIVRDNSLLCARVRRSIGTIDRADYTFARFFMLLSKGRLRQISDNCVLIVAT